MAGRFISLDGIDGTGKSTQVRHFADWLAGRGREVVVCRDPGGTTLGERLRDLILHQADVEMGPRAETLLYMAARAQLVEERIRPALERGAIVVADRFLLANVAYQGFGWGLAVDELWQVGSFATAGLCPDCVFLLDLPVGEALQRCGNRHDRLETRGEPYFQRVREGFLQEAQRNPDTICVVDASRSVDEVQETIRREAVRRLPELINGLDGPGRA